MRPILALCAALLLFPATGALAQGGGLFANPKNLKVLPEDISEEQLRAIMRGFAQATGIRCSGCHVPVEGKPLNEWDFTLDDKPQKNIARDMLRMTAQINKTLGEMESFKGHRKGDPVGVRCVTCHRGVEKPRMIQDILNDYKAEKNATGAVTHYRELFSAYYGTHSYDLSAPTLGSYAHDRAGEGLMDFAFALHELNRDLHPDNAAAYLFWGNSLMLAEDFEAALAAFNKAIELDPDNRFARSLAARAEQALKGQQQ